MKPGSVIVDLAASTGGNCELTKNNETVVSEWCDHYRKFQFCLHHTL